MDKADLLRTDPAELLAQLSNSIGQPPAGAGLTSAQWGALHYFSRANRFSRTVSAFATYQATTRGTASETVKRLVERGYLRRSKRADDARSHRLDVTSDASVLLEDDPFCALERAVRKMPAAKQDVLRGALKHIAREMARERPVTLFGICRSCAYLRSGAQESSREVSWACARFGEPLREDQLVQLCADFEDPTSGRFG